MHQVTNKIVSQTELVLCHFRPYDIMGLTLGKNTYPVPSPNLFIILGLELKGRVLLGSKRGSLNGNSCVGCLCVEEVMRIASNKK